MHEQFLSLHHAVCYNLLVKKPKKPEFVKVSSKRSHSTIKIRWKVPGEDYNSIANFEVQKRRKGRQYKRKFKIPPIKFSVTFVRLKQYTDYFFQVRSTNEHFVSEWSSEISASTKFSKVVKFGVAFGPFVAHTLTAPFQVAFAAGKKFNDKAEERKFGKVVTGFGTAGVVMGGTILGTVGSPAYGGYKAYKFVTGDSPISDQSDDDQSDDEGINFWVKQRWTNH